MWICIRIAYTHLHVSQKIPHVNTCNRWLFKSDNKTSKHTLIHIHAAFVSPSRFSMLIARHALDWSPQSVPRAIAEQLEQDFTNWMSFPMPNHHCHSMEG